MYRWEDIAPRFLNADIRIATFNRSETDELFEHFRMLNITWSGGEDLEKDKYWGFSRFDSEHDCVIYEMHNVRESSINALLRSFDRYQEDPFTELIKFSDIIFSKIEINNNDFIELLNNI